jgi:hypothetical protein
MRHKTFLNIRVEFLASVPDDEFKDPTLDGELNDICAFIDQTFQNDKPVIQIANRQDKRAAKARDLCLIPESLESEWATFQTQLEEKRGLVPYLRNQGQGPSSSTTLNSLLSKPADAGSTGSAYRGIHVSMSTAYPSTSIAPSSIANLIPLDPQPSVPSTVQVASSGTPPPLPAATPFTSQFPVPTRQMLVLPAIGHLKSASLQVLIDYWDALLSDIKYVDPSFDYYTQASIRVRAKEDGAVWSGAIINSVDFSWLDKRVEQIVGNYNALGWELFRRWKTVGLQWDPHKLYSHSAAASGTTASASALDQAPSSNSNINPSAFSSSQGDTSSYSPSHPSLCFTRPFGGTNLLKPFQPVTSFMAANGCQSAAANTSTGSYYSPTRESAKQFFDALTNLGRRYPSFRSTLPLPPIQVQASRARVLQITMLLPPELKQPPRQDYPIFPCRCFREGIRRDLYDGFLYHFGFDRLHYSGCELRQGHSWYYAPDNAVRVPCRSHY